MNRNFLIFGLVLLLPSLFAVDSALSIGPASWALSQESFWGTPIADFVFWIGLAHAGTLFSAILLVLGVRWQHRVAFLAELSTIAALGVAASFPLIHLGIPEAFYNMIPVGNARSMYVNVESPLVWDFVAIFVYGTVSVLYLLLHLFSIRNASLEKYRRPFAWILFPLVLWVHTIVSLDFAVTFVPGWQGAYFPLYFIFGALFSGVALVQILVELSHRRVRAVEDLLIAFSWALLAFWMWEANVKAVWHPELLIFGFLVPQLLWISKVREISVVRALVAISVMASLWWERIGLVQPENLDWTWVDLGLASFGIGAFCVAFALLRILLKKFFPQAFDEDVMETLRERAVSFERKKFWISVGVGTFAAGAFAVYFIWNAPAFPGVRMIPVLFPIGALCAGISLSLFAIAELWKTRVAVMCAVLLAVFAVAVGGLLYRGTDVSYTESLTTVESVNPALGTSKQATAELWNARCAACHGKDGNLNRKFVHEFYPLPQTLSLERLDSLGLDSLSKVVLEGRNYMRPFRGRVTDAEAFALVRYMRSLAVQKKGGAVP